MFSVFFAILKEIGTQRLIALLVFMTGIGLELSDRTVLGAELIALSAVKLLALQDGRDRGDKPSDGGG